MTSPLSLRSWLLLSCTCVLVLSVNLGGSGVVTSHEMDVAGGARQMLEDGDWLVPKIGDVPWLEKPPLLHWLAAGCLALSSPYSHWAVRVPSMLAGAGVVFLMAWLIGAWMGEAAGLIAGIVQCTSWYLMAYARLAEADMLLALNVVAAVVVFVRLQGIGLPAPSPRPRTLAVVFWALIGLTNLSKGPLFGAAMVLVPAGAWLLWQRDRTAWRRLWSPRGFLLALVIAGTWPVLVIAREPWALDLWLEHTFGRAAGTLGFGQPWWYYLSTVPYQLLPWTLATLKGAVPSLRRGWQQRDSADRFLWLWGLLPIFVLSLSHGKHHHYLIHCLPAFTAVTTMGILAMGKEIQQRRRDSRFVAWLLVLLIAPALLAAGFFVGQRLPAMRTEIALLGIISALAAAAAGVCSLRARPRAVFIVAALSIIACVIVVKVGVLGKRDDRRPDYEFLTTLHEALPPGALLISTGGEEIARHIFVSRVPVVGVWEPKDVGKHVGNETIFYVVTRKRNAPELEPLGTVTVLGQSSFSRGERSAEDRLTLFRIERTD